MMVSKMPLLLPTLLVACHFASAFVVFQPQQGLLVGSKWAGLSRTSTLASSSVEPTQQTEPKKRYTTPGFENRRPGPDRPPQRERFIPPDRPQRERGGPPDRPQRERGPPRAGGGAGGPPRGGPAGGTALRLLNPMKLQRIVTQTPVDDPQSWVSDRPPSANTGGGGGGGNYAGNRSSPNNNNRNNNVGNNNNRGPSAGTRPPRRAPGADGGGTATEAGTAAGREYGSDNDRSDRFFVRAAAVAPAAPLKDTGRRRDFGKPVRKGGRRDDGADEEGRPRGVGAGRRRDGDDSVVDVVVALDPRRNTGGTSLRVGTSRSAPRRRGSLKKRNRSADREARLEAAIERKTVYLYDGPMTVSELAEKIDEKPVSVIKMLMSDLGIMASMTQTLDPATCIAVAQGFGKVVAGVDDDDDDLDYDEDSALATGVADDEDDEADLVPRPPVVTIMGHVDHGKTSLLDAIRNTHVTDGEAGGITQHIAAYQVNHKGKMITFIDTPGHAAFTDMRERGANITDIVILVVAADDGVKQQTKDSIMCARQAGVPLVIAINKCDLDTADPVKVMTDLTGYDILTEDLGGEVLCSQISAKTGKNLEDVLDKIMLQAEVQDLKANPTRDAECIVVEAKVEKGLGTVATTLVKRGTLRIGDIFVAGETYGRVRALISTSDGKTRLKEAPPSTPVRVVGFEGVPSAGDILVVTQDEQTARDLAESRQRIARERSSSSYQAGLMDSVALAFGGRKERREMFVVVKADVQGSAEALSRSLQNLKLENEEAVVNVRVLVSEAGEVSKSDIAIASVTPGTIVIAFNVPAAFAAMEDARAAGIDIEYYNIIYDAIESVEKRMQEVLSPTPEGEYVGTAVVQEVFNIGGTGNIAGSRCTDGYLRKGGNVRVLRGDKILCESKIVTLRSFKADVDSIEEGNECGIGLQDFESFQPDDIVECYIVKK